MKRALGVAAILLAASGAAGADPLRLRADAYGRAESPVGLLVLEGDNRVRPWLRAEAVVWLGSEDANVLTIAVRARDPGGSAEARIGRLVVTSGALRPVQLDGVAGRARLAGFQAEAWGGMPVIAGAERRSWDWAAGTRLSRPFGDHGAVGVAFGERRDHGRIVDREVGADAFVAPTGWLDASGRVAFDLVQPGISEAMAVVSASLGARVRLDVSALQRSPARLLPATSLFSVLGDVPSRRLGSTVRWRAAPRLDLDGAAFAVTLGDDVGVDASARARLRLDDRGAGAITVELRREALADAGWTGARASLSLPVAPGLAFSTELELAIPDAVCAASRASITKPCASPR